MKEEIVIQKEDVITETCPIEESKKKSEKKTETEIDIIDLNNNMNLNMKINNLILITNVFLKDSQI